MLGCPIIRPETLGDLAKIVDYCGRVHGGDRWVETALLGVLALVVPVAIIVGYALVRRWQA